MNTRNVTGLNHGLQKGLDQWLNECMKVAHTTLLFVENEQLPNTAKAKQIIDAADTQNRVPRIMSGRMLFQGVSRPAPQLDVEP